MPSQQQGLGFLLGDVYRLLRRAFELQLADSPLTHAAGRVLVHLSRHQGIRQVELAQLLDIQPITLARLLDQLMENHLVERRPDPADRRAYRLYLLPDAAPHLAAIEQVGSRVRADALRGVEAPDAAIAISVLERMRDNLASRAEHQ